MSVRIPISIARPYIQLVMSRTGWKQVELASKTGFTQASISKWLSGKDPKQTVMLASLKGVRRATGIPFTEPLASMAAKDSPLPASDDLEEALKLLHTLCDEWGFKPDARQQALALKRIQEWLRERPREG